VAFIHKIYVNYYDCDRNKGYELPALLTEQGVLISHLRYLSLNFNKSGTWKEKATFAIKLLLLFINKNNNNYPTATELLRSFSKSLLTGTIDLQTMRDPLELYWRIRTITDANNLLYHITNYTDFLAKQNGFEESLVNPLRKATRHEERLNWCAYYNKQVNVFLNHLRSPHKDSDDMKFVREVSGFKDIKRDIERSPRFPEKYRERFILTGFFRNGIQDYKSQAMTMLMNYGGLRKSELFHLYTSDIQVHPNHKEGAIVRVYHPQYGKSPDANFKNRSEYLESTTSYMPRNKYRLSKRLYAGWKDPRLIHKNNYFEVIFNPPEKAREFLETWKNYLLLQRVEPKQSEFHPFAFTNSIGEPETIKNFQRIHKDAVERIGQICRKEYGTTEHGHRHAYGYRCRSAGLEQEQLQVAMHHKSPLSCLIYSQPTSEDIRSVLKRDHEGQNK
jgi:hypothetical protein